MFLDFAWILALAAGVGLLAAHLRQPSIVAFIVVGILVGPAVLGWVGHNDAVEVLAQLGVTVLLFLVGLKLDPALVRQLGPVAMATGLGQLGFTIAFGFLIALAMGMDGVTALYVAVALTFSSTIIIIKLLGDKRELDSLHGRIATGFLIVQDIAVVLAMMVIGALGVGAGAEQGAIDWWGWGIRLLAAMLAVFVLVRFGLRWILPWMATAPELMVVFSVAWGVALAALGEQLGLSKEVGAFIAGFALAGTPFREAVGARLSGLRDFLLLFFFVELGSKLAFADLGSQLPAALVLSVFVLVGNPLIVMAIMGFMGYRRRTGFLAGLTVAQISEFSAIFVAMGVALGHVGAPALSLVTLVGLVTIALGYPARGRAGARHRFRSGGGRAGAPARPAGALRRRRGSGIRAHPATVRRAPGGLHPGRHRQRRPPSPGAGRGRLPGPLRRRRAPARCRRAPAPPGRRHPARSVRGRRRTGGHHRARLAQRRSCATHLSSIAIGVGSALMPRVVRHGARAGSGKNSAQTAL